jgi:FMN-dependent oxidoreductase (nitrilotriacetate monooxygenase family)
MTERRLHLNAVIYGLGSHEAAWRLPESDPFAIMTLGYWVDIARRAEAGGFDALFLGDVLALQEGADRHLSNTMDPFVILSALAAVTTKIGLIGTASTSFDHPFHLARRFGSLDHISKGRAGWNIVTSSNAREAHNFGLEDMPAHVERYSRAEDVVTAVKALWDSWEPGAQLADQQRGQYLDIAKVHRVDHAGPYVQTRGPMNIPRPPQGHPVLAQAGSSPAGRAFAARHADIVFTVQSSLPEAQAFYAEMKELAKAAGRDPAHLLILPGIIPVVGETKDVAEARLAEMNGLAVHEHLIAKLSAFLGRDLSGLDLDAPLPEGTEPSTGLEASQSRVAALVGIARREALTLRQLLLRLASGRGHLLTVGTGQHVASVMQEWFENGAADGFNVMCPVMPGDLQSFTELVMPELERIGLRTGIHTETLRDRYRLPAH